MNKNMLITGGALRIGEAIALFFAQKKWNIGIHYNKSKKEALKLQKKILSLESNAALLNLIYRMTKMLQNFFQK